MINKLFCNLSFARQYTFTLLTELQNSALNLMCGGRAGGRAGGRQQLKWNFIHLLPMSQGGALFIFGSKVKVTGHD